jgi:hypothetical protein
MLDCLIFFHVQYPAPSLFALSISPYAQKLGYGGMITAAGPEVLLQADWILKKLQLFQGC